MIAEVTPTAPPSPFIARFAIALDPQAIEILRYDATRQVSQVLIGDAWVDALEAPAGSSSTKLTKVAQETTDDA